MGNYKFQFSNMLPNAWFYKLKYTTPIKTRNLNSSYNRNTHPKTKSSSSFTATAAIEPRQAWRQSYYFQRELNNVPPTNPFSEAPRKSTKRRISRRRTRASLVNFSAASSNELVMSKPDSTPEMYASYRTDSSCFDDSGFSDLDSEFERLKVDSASKQCQCRADNNYAKLEKKFDLVSQSKLKPIITKKIDKGGDHEIVAPAKFKRNGEQSSCNVKEYTKNQRKTRTKRMTATSPGGVGIKLKASFRKTGSKRGGQVHGRKDVKSETKNVIIVKDSIDPDTDFKESMVEMILENNIRTSEDLEKLLVCYLSLNSSAYHSRIINIFEQIWFQITDI